MFHKNMPHKSHNTKLLDKKILIAEIPENIRIIKKTYSQLLSQKELQGDYQLKVL